MPYSFGNTFNNNWSNWNWNSNTNSNWNNSGAWNWNTGSWNSNWSGSVWGSGTSAPSTEEKSAEEIRKERIKKAEENQKARKANNEKLAELKQKLEELNKGTTDESGNIITKDSTATQLNAIKNGHKKEDGSVAVYDTEFTKMTTGDKIKRGAINAFSGMANVFKSLAGFDKNGKWNPVKCAINVGIAAGVIALCATGVLAPVGAALAASLGSGAVATAIGTTVASLPAILAATGVATGGYMAVKGAIDTGNAKNMEEFDNATQDIGAGVFIGGTSLCGLKGMGNAAGLSGAARFNPFAIGRAGMNTAAESMLTAAGEQVVYNTNAAGNPTSVSLKNINSSLWKHIKVGREAALKLPIDKQNSRFEQSLNKAKQDLWNEAADLDTQIQATETAGNAKLAMTLKMKQDTILNNLDALDNAKDYTSWKAATNGNKSFMEQLKGYKDTLQRDGQVEINGRTFKTEDAAELKSIIKEITGKNKEITKLISGLKKQRLESMKKMATHKSFSQDVADFGYKDGTGWTGIKGQLINYWKTFTGGFGSKFSFQKGLIWKGINQLFILMDPSFLAYEVAGPAKHAINIMTCFASPHEMNADKVLTAQEVTEEESRLTALLKNFTDAESAIKNEITALEDANRKLTA